MQLLAGQNIAVYSYITGSYSGTYVQSESGFSVALLGPNMPHQGFHAGGNSIAVRAPGWREVTSWKTNYTTNTGFYSTDASWDGSRYTVATPGIYYVSANIRMDSTNLSSILRVIIAINQNYDINNGLHAIETHKAAYTTLTVAGFVRVNTGDVISVFVYSEDTSYVTQAQSGFSVNRMGSAFSRSAFLADLESEIQIPASVRGNWYDLTGTRANWTVEGNYGLFQTDLSFSPTTGVYTVPVTGYYYVTANVRIDGAKANSYYFVLVAINRQRTHTNGLQAVRGTGTTKVTSFSETVAGALYATAGQQISVAVYGSQGSFSISHESSFSVCQLFNMVYGFQADLKSSYAIRSGTGTKKVVGSGVAWLQSGSGLFNFATSGKRFTNSQGYMTVPSDGSGVYLIAAQVSRLKKPRFSCYYPNPLTPSSPPSPVKFFLLSFTF